MNRLLKLMGTGLLGVVAIGCDFWLMREYKPQMVALVGGDLHMVISIGSVIVVSSFFANRSRRYF